MWWIHTIWWTLWQFDFCLVRDHIAEIWIKIMAPKDDPETAALKKELEDLIAKLKV